MESKTKTYVWRWVANDSGPAGYNSCSARTRQEALKKARAMGEPKGRFLGLVVNELTLHVARKGEIDALDREFRSLCD